MATKTPVKKSKFHNRIQSIANNKKEESTILNVPWLEKKFNYFLSIFLISLISSSLYFQTYSYDFTQDDATYTIENSATLKGIKGIPDIFTHGSLNYYVQEPTNTGVYRPITLTTFAIEHQLFGNFDPKVDHLINVFLYFILLLLVGSVLQILFKRVNLPVILTLMILLMYGLHPIHTEVVASIKSRDTLLASVFAFGAVLFWLSEKERRTTRLNYIHKIIASFIFFLAILSKEEAITFVAVIFLTAYFFKRLSLYKSIKESVPFLIVTCIYLFARFLILDPPITTYNSILNNIIYDLHGPDRLATNFYVYLFYIKLLVYPFPLSMDYSYNQISPKTFANIWVILSLFFFGFLILKSLKLFTKRNLLSFCFLYYLCTFSIFSNFTESITIGSTVGERFMFLPSLGFCMVIIYGFYMLVNKINFKPRFPVIISILLPICLIYSIKTFSRTKVWRDNLTLYETGIKAAPNSWRIHNNLAEDCYTRTVRLSLIQNKNRIQIDSLFYWGKRAKEQYESAFEILKNQNATPYYSLMHYGMILFNLQDTLGARMVFRKVTMLSSNLSSAWFNLATIAYYRKQYDSSVVYLNHALSAKAPDSFAIYKYLGSSYLMLKDHGNSIKNYEKALSFHKDQEITNSLSFLYSIIRKYDSGIKVTNHNSEIINSTTTIDNVFNTANIAYANGDYKSAINYFNHCKGIYKANSENAKLLSIYNLLGQAYLKLNQIDAAKQAYKELLQIDPSNYSALQNLGLLAFKIDKNYNLAIKYLTKSLQSPTADYYFSYSSLGFLYSINNMTDEAIKNFENSLKYKSSKEILQNLYRLWKIKGNVGKANQYEELLLNMK